MQDHTQSRRAFLRLLGRPKQGDSKHKSKNLDSGKTNHFPEHQTSCSHSIDSVLESMNSPFELEIEDLPKTTTSHHENAICGVAKISELECMAYHHTVCQICKDICPEHIHFSASLYPEILSSCIGCGKCIAQCPTNAISLEKISDKESL